MVVSKAREMMEKLAEKEGISIGELRREIENAIDFGLSSPDPSAKAYWDSIPKKGAKPTPEETICYIANDALKNISADSETATSV